HSTTTPRRPFALHDALPISIIARAARRLRGRYEDELASCARQPFHEGGAVGETRQNDRCRGEVASAGAGTVGEHRAFERPDAWRSEDTRLNSSHQIISDAVF